MNNHITRQIHSDAKKHSSFLAMLSVAGDSRRQHCIQNNNEVGMKIFNICILFILLWGSAIGKSNSDTDQSVFPQQLTARDLLTYCSSSSLTDLGRMRQRYCRGFISGVEETIRLPLHSHRQPAELRTCAPKGITSRQLTEAYIQYAGRLSTNLSQPAAQIVIEALSNSYPCSN